MEAMKIVKYCNKVHNPLVSQTTIQVCSVYHYKAVDNDFIRDPEEGEMSRSYNPATPTFYSGDDIGAMTGFSIAGNGGIRFEGRAVRTTNPILNAYVFCTSCEDNPTAKRAMSLGYDSFYPIGDPELFSQRLGHEIKQQVPDASDVRILHKRVGYLENKEVELNNLPIFVQSHRRIDFNLYFLKRNTSRDNPSKVYAEDKEYRFVFLPIDGKGQPVPLSEEKLHLDSNGIKPIIETSIFSTKSISGSGSRFIKR